MIPEILDEALKRVRRKTLAKELIKEEYAFLFDYIDEAVADEREACARVVENWGKGGGPYGKRLASLIRARGEK